MSWLTTFSIIDIGIAKTNAGELAAADGVAAAGRDRGVHPDDLPIDVEVLN